MQKKKHLILTLVLAGILLACFFAFLILVVNNYSFKMDILNFILANKRTSFWNKFFEYFSVIGNFYFLLGLTIVVFVVVLFKYKQKSTAIFLGLSFAFVAVINFFIKNVVKRARPENIMLFEEFSYSFPSWHTMLTCFVFGVLILFLQYERYLRIYL